MSSTDMAEAPLGTGLLRRKLRNFGLVMGGACAILATVLWWRGSAWLVLPATIGVFFIGAALFFPVVLAPAERAWMALARVLAMVSTTVLLTLAFLFIVTPLGLILRLMGKDLLAIRRDPTRSSYWVTVEKDGPCDHPERPY